MDIKANQVSPEVVAVISAAVQHRMSNKVVEVSIKRADNWTLAGRQSIL